MAARWCPKLAGKTSVSSCVAPARRNCSCCLDLQEIESRTKTSECQLMRPPRQDSDPSPTLPLPAAPRWLSAKARPRSTAPGHPRARRLRSQRTAARTACTTAATGSGAHDATSPQGATEPAYDTARTHSTHVVQNPVPLWLNLSITEVGTLLWQPRLSARYLSSL